MIVFFLSDLLVWIITTSLLFLFIRTPKKFSTLWRQQKIACSFLLFWIILALLDSVHWQTSEEFCSLLDYLFDTKKLGQIGSEKGYYAPFSSHSYKKIQMATAQENPWIDNQWVRDFLPSKYIHILGTDKIGTDILWACCKSFRTAFLLSFLSIFWTLLFAIPFGMLAGWFVKLDKPIQFIANIINGVPSVLLIALMSVVMDLSMNQTSWLSDFTSEQKSDFKLWGFCFILGATSWTGYMRLIRQKTIELSLIHI
jgi:ABC-type dipeptide/oligopeptide/nickel transport system permease subunit